MRWKLRGRDQGSGIGGQGAEVGGQNSDIRRRRTEVRSRKSGRGFRPLIAGFWLLFSGFLLFGDVDVVWAFEEVGADTTHMDSVTVKSPMGAMVRSMAVPGWGQWYNERPIKGAVIFSTELFFGGAMVYEQERTLDHRQRNTYLLWFLGVFLYNIADAYVDAHLYGFEEDAETMGLVYGNSDDRMPMIFMRIRF